MSGEESLKELLQTLQVLKDIEAGQKAYRLACLVMNTPEPDRSENVARLMREQPLRVPMSTSDFIVRARYICKLGPIACNAELQIVARANFYGPSNDQCHSQVDMPAVMKEQFFAKLAALEQKADERGCKAAAGEVDSMLAGILKA